MTAVRLVFLVTALLGLAACAQDDPQLVNIPPQAAGDGPDEFGIVPNRPLETPSDFASLPPPTPGGGNLADPDPVGDIAEALGGTRAATRSSGALSGEPALIAQVGRFGIDGGIRATLAEEDLEFRRQNDGRILERLFNVNLYFEAYEPQSLDPFAELERLRRAGVRTPAVPPRDVLIGG